MGWMSPLSDWNRCCRTVFRASVILAFMGSVAGSAAALGADLPPTLVVPANKMTLHVAVALSEGALVRRDGAWRLVEIGSPQVQIPAQLVPAIAADGSAGAEFGRLVAAIPRREGAEGPRQFRLLASKGGSPNGQQEFRFEEISDKSLKLSDGQSPVLVYNHGLITDEQVPKNDHRRRRACYIHPLWGLRGEVLTDDFPKDHYHHHGVFWTWPHVGVAGEEYSLWDGSKIEDRFVRWICRRPGPVAAVLAVENGWFVGGKEVMIERVWLRVFKVSGGARALDLEFIWIPVDKPITLRGAEGKSYGGLTVRFAPRSREDTLITVPSGRTTEDLPDTPLAWADFTSRFGDADARSGAAIFVHPRHPDYPPTWLTRYYGPLCVGWPGVKARTFEPGKPIRLDYRIWIHKSAVEPEELKRAYAGYVTATKVHWE
jgi:hypothetical protein